MLLDQQVPTEWAFAGPVELHERLGHLDPEKIAAMDTDDFVAVCVEKPSIHRFPGSIGKRIHSVCEMLVADCEGDAPNIWGDIDSGTDLYDRLRALLGYGDEVTKIFVAILAKPQEVAPAGWQAAASRFGDRVPCSVADVHDEISLGKVRDWKKAQRARKKYEQDRRVK